MEEKFYTTEEAMQMLRIEKITLYGWLRKGKIAAVRPGKRWLIPESEIQRIMSYRKMNTTEDIKEYELKLQRALDEYNKAQVG